MAQDVTLFSSAGWSLQHSEGWWEACQWPVPKECLVLWDALSNLGAGKQTRLWG